MMMTMTYGDDAAECEEDEISGTITAALTVDNTFEIDGQPVRIIPRQPQFEGVRPPTSWSVERRGQGVLGADGVLVAVEVELGDDDD